MVEKIDKTLNSKKALINSALNFKFSDEDRLFMWATKKQLPKNKYSDIWRRAFMYYRAASRNFEIHMESRVNYLIVYNFIAAERDWPESKINWEDYDSQDDNIDQS